MLTSGQVSGSGIALNIIHLAASEGISVALEEAEKIQSALETIASIGSPSEVASISFLLQGVRRGIQEIMEGRLVTLVREEYLPNIIGEC